MSKNDTVGKNGVLSVAQGRAVAILLTGETVRGTAREIGLSEATLYRWLRLPHFRAALAEAETERARLCSARFTGLLSLALDSLQSDLANPMSRGHRDARRGVLTSWARLAEYAGLLSRVQTLEERIFNEPTKPN